MNLGMYIALEQIQTIEGRQKFLREAAKAFKRLEVNRRVYFTCNVARLQECNRLGEEAEVSLWRTHLFMHSPSFQDCDAVIFNQRPGLELGDFARSVCENVYVQLDGGQTILNVATGDRVTLSEPIVFASDEAES